MTQQEEYEMEGYRAPQPERTPIAAEGASGNSKHNIQYHDGPLMTAAEVVTIFWGSAWDEMPDHVRGLNEFFDYVLKSPLIDQLGEYSVGEQRIGPGKLAASITVTKPGPGREISDGRIQDFLRLLIERGRVPEPSANVVYFVYLPPGTWVEIEGNLSYRHFCGYHNHIDARIIYAVVPFPDHGACQIPGNRSHFDALTATSSHELCEVITDPTIEGWCERDKRIFEIGDACSWMIEQLGDFDMQAQWSNEAQACVLNNLRREKAMETRDETRDKFDTEIEFRDHKLGRTGGRDPIPALGQSSGHEPPNVVGNNGELKVLADRVTKLEAKFEALWTYVGKV